MPITAPPPEIASQFGNVYRYLLPRLNFLEQLAVPLLGFPTSWWRSLVRNQQVGGDTRSQHLFGFAADWGGMQAGERDTFVRTARAIGLVAVDEGDHVHVQTFHRGAIPDRFFADLRARRIPV